MIVYQILILMGLISFGFFIRRKNIVSEHFIDDCSNFILLIGMPSLLLSTLIKTEFSIERIEGAYKIFTIAIIGYVLSIVFSEILVRVLKIASNKKAIFQFALIFFNIGFMGFPVINSIYGSEGLFYASVVNLLYNVFLWTVGVYIFSKAEGHKLPIKNIINPSTTAIALGLLLFILPVSVPDIIIRFLEIIGGSTTLLAMLSIGMILSREKFELYSFIDKDIIIGCILCNIAIPLILIFCMSLFFDTDKTFFVYMLTTLMPAGSTTAIFAYKYKSEYMFASKLVSASTILSGFTIPIIYLALT